MCPRREQHFMLHVGINGFGTIGKRVADAVRKYSQI